MCRSVANHVDPDQAALTWAHTVCMPELDLDVKLLHCQRQHIEMRFKGYHGTETVI